jgi:hypothetical protein
VSTQRLPSLWAIHSMPGSSECTGRYTQQERSFCGCLSRLGPWFTCMTLSLSFPCQLSMCRRLQPWKFHRFLDIVKDHCSRHEGKHPHIKIIYYRLSAPILRIQLTVTSINHKHDPFSPDGLHLHYTISSSTSYYNRYHVNTPSLLFL